MKKHTDSISKTFFINLIKYDIVGISEEAF